jgi:hypothetical protein
VDPLDGQNYIAALNSASRNEIPTLRQPYLPQPQLLVCATTSTVAVVV